MRQLLALAAMAAVAGCAAQEEARLAASQPPLEQAAARLPEQVADFTRGNTVWHERDRPGLGASVDYAGPARAAVATVSLYDRGQPPLAAGDPRLATEFTSAVSEVMALAGTRTSQELSETGRSELPVPGGDPLACSRLEGTYGRQQVRTLVCLGQAAGRYLKVQVTAPARPVRPVDPMPFVVGIAQAARGA
jgi:hypothetical protein